MSVAQSLSASERNLRSIANNLADSRDDALNDVHVSRAIWAILVADQRDTADDTSVLASATRDILAADGLDDDDQYVMDTFTRASKLNGNLNRENGGRA